MHTTKKWAKALFADVRARARSWAHGLVCIGENACTIFEFACSGESKSVRVLVAFTKLSTFVVISIGPSAYEKKTHLPALCI